MSKKKTSVSKDKHKDLPFLDSHGFDTREGEEIRPAEFSRRMGVDQSYVNSWERLGHVFRNKNDRFVWPHCRNDLETRKQNHVKAKAEKRTAALVRRENAKTTGEIPPAKPQAPGKPPINISRKDITNNKLVHWLIAGMENLQDTALAGTYQFAKAFEQLLKVEKAQTAMLVEKGDLIDRKAAFDTALAQANHKRNVWMNTPERIAVEFAEEAGIDRRLAYDLLTKHIHATLELIADSADDALTETKKNHVEEEPDQDELLVEQELKDSMTEEEFEEESDD